MVDSNKEIYYKRRKQIIQEAVQKLRFFLSEMDDLYRMSVCKIRSRKTS